MAGDCVPLVVSLGGEIALGKKHCLRDNRMVYGEARDTFKGIEIQLETGHVDFFCGALAVGGWHVVYHSKKYSRLTYDQRLSIYRRVKRALRAYRKRGKQNSSYVFGDRNRKPGDISLWEMGKMVADYSTPTYINCNSGNPVRLFIING